MSLKNVRNHFKRWNREADIMEFSTSSATVDQAAATIGVQPAQIAKTLSFRGADNKAILVVSAGDARVDNKKFCKAFQIKARMLSPDDVLEQTGHAIGGVCPFGLTNDLDVYVDISLKRFDYVYPACGSLNSAIKLTCAELAEYAATNDWVDVCKGWEEVGQVQATSMDSNG
ncbi:YbaK/EbsC family protein [Lentibacillus sp. N15]|uniref:YbaK/EbsC family protein n=1 Tax=Lentibacillus songyuanensis TaxID=3136161 RepID=UPI0031B9B31B